MDTNAAAGLRSPLQPSARIRIAPATYAEPGLLQLPGAHMHLMENAHDFYPSVALALQRAGSQRTLYAYPDPQYQTLKAAIAQEAGTTPDHLAVAPGSSELIDRVLRLFCSAGDAIVTTRPTWSFFDAFVRRWQLVPTQVPMRGSLRQGDLQHDLEGLLAAITPRTRLVYLANPCNPTGSTLAPRALEAFVQSLPGHVVAVIDEAYLPYADEECRPALAALVDRCAARVILLRTFSKFFGLAGLRVGYALTSPDTVQLLSHAEIPFSVGAPAVVAAEAALADLAFRQHVFDTNRDGRRQLLAGLAALGMPAQASQTNFVLFQPPITPKTIRDDLRRLGLVLPHVHPFFDGCAMLTVGLPEHNAQILEYLAGCADLRVRA
ncbi:MAG TPA: histidinol-phosphate transaminase [Burkholderiaceae bacterium]|nr:histidinol-phosphate transaminase [Burkholderiaceae bacterium]